MKKYIEPDLRRRRRLTLIRLLEAEAGEIGSAPPPRNGLSGREMREWVDQCKKKRDEDENDTTP